MSVTETTPTSRPDGSSTGAPEISFSSRNSASCSIVMSSRTVSTLGFMTSLAVIGLIVPLPLRPSFGCKNTPFTLSAGTGPAGGRQPGLSRLGIESGPEMDPSLLGQLADLLLDLLQGKRRGLDLRRALAAVGAGLEREAPLPFGRAPTVELDPFEGQLAALRALRGAGRGQEGGGEEAEEGDSHPG